LSGGATQKIHQNVKNASQQKREFLRQIQEEENFSRNTNSNFEEKSGSSFDDLEGQVRKYSYLSSKYGFKKNSPFSKKWDF
jgi:hypothetical protein